MNMETSVQNQDPPDGRKIESLAYSLWERAGRPLGRDVEFWLEAERQINATARPAVTRPAPAQTRSAAGTSLVRRAPAGTKAAASKPKEWSPLLLSKENAGGASKNAARPPEPRQRRAASA